MNLISSGQGTAELVTLDALARHYQHSARARSTTRAYTSDWNHFLHWCNRNGLSPLPAAPHTIALYITALAADHRPSTISRRLTVINQAHRLAGRDAPTSAEVTDVLKGIRRQQGTWAKAKNPLLPTLSRRQSSRSDPRTAPPWTARRLTCGFHRTHRPTRGRARWPRAQPLRRAQPTRWPGHASLSPRHARARHHDPDRTPQRRRSPSLHTECRHLPRQSGQCVGSVTAASAIPARSIGWKLQLRLPKGQLRIEGAVDLASLRVVLECLLG